MANDELAKAPAVASVQADRQSILKATGLCAVIAALITLLVILPAEYGKDYTGFGRLTGLTQLAAAEAESDAAAEGAQAIAASAADSAAPSAEGKAQPLTLWGADQPAKYEVRRYDVPLAGDEEFEYKAKMQRGDLLLSSWKIKQGSMVYYEFHGQPTEGQWAADYYESYSKGEAASAHSRLVAPFTGDHGWYWLNLSEKPVVIEVELAGYFKDFAKVVPPPFPEPPPG